MIQWPQTITYKINPDVNYSHEAIRAGFDLWASVADVAFKEIDDPVAQFLIADLGVVKDVFGISDDVDAVNVWTHADGVGVNSYIGLDEGRLEHWDLTRAAAHEIGHGFGIFPDRPDASPLDTIYSYDPVGGANLEADDIEAIQAALGASPADNVIRAGHGSGMVSGGQGDDLIYGNGGSDLIYGNGDSDTLYGGWGFDTIYGGRGDDFIDGGRGHDVLAGNAGSDVFRVTDGDDTITDFGGDDRLILGDNVTADRISDGLLVSHDGGTVTLIGVSEWSPDFLV